MIQIENRAEESDHGEDDDHAAYYLIDNDDAVGIKLVPNLVDEPGESEPPQQGSEDDAEIPYSHSTGISGTTKANCAKVAMKRNTMSGLESVTRNAVMPLCIRVPCLLLDLCMFFIGSLLKQ